MSLGVARGLVTGALVLVSALSAWAAPQKISLGFNPGGDPEKIRPLALALAGDLQTETGLAVEILISKDYAGLVTAMKEKKIDFAFFTARTFVEAERVAGAKVLLKKVWKEESYRPALVALAKSPLRKIDQLKGKRIAFVDKESASGYLYPMAKLREAGLKESDFAKVEWTGHHNASVRALISGDVDVAAVFADDAKARTGAWTKSEVGSTPEVRVLWVGEAIPNDPFCVRQDFYVAHPMITHSVMLGLIDLFERNREKYASLLGAKSLVPATSRQYDSVRQMLKTFQDGRP